MSGNLKTHLRRPPVIIAAAGLIALGAVAYALVTSGNGSIPSIVRAEMGPVVEDVRTTGSVKAAQEVDLSFQTSGRIASVRYDVGSHVFSGASIASLSDAGQAAQLEQAKATLAMQQANLDSLKAGATSQSIAASQVGVSNAQAAVTTAQEEIIQAAQDTYFKADDAIHNRVDQIFTNPRSSNPLLNVGLSDSQALVDIQSQRVTIENELSAWLAFEQTLSNASTATDATGIVSQTRNYIHDVLSYLDLVSGALTNAVPTAAYPLATIQSYQTNIATGRTDLSTSLSGLNTAATALTAANSALEAAKAQLNLTTAGATQNDIDAQAAQVEAAQAAVDYAQAQLAQTTIYAPIAGTISMNNAHVGSTASPGAVLVSILSDSRFQMETYVSQTDLSKLAVGQSATITLDTYPTSPLPAHVIAIDPAATVQDGVSSYKVTLQFDTNDPKIKVGMSGSIVFVVGSKEDTLFVPSSAIIRNGTSSSVLKRVGNAFVLTPVSIGIEGGGKSEIVNGLQVGDELRSFGQY